MRKIRKERRRKRTGDGREVGKRTGDGGGREEELVVIEEEETEEEGKG